MTLESFIKKTFSSIGSGIENIRKERAKRLSNPVFQRELLNSRNEFVKHLTNTASHTWDAAYQILLHAPIATTGFAVKYMFDKKITTTQLVHKLIDEFGKGAGSLGRALLEAGKTVGRGSLHTLRWLTAK